MGESGVVTDHNFSCCFSMDRIQIAVQTGTCLYHVYHVVYSRLFVDLEGISSCIGYCIHVRACLSWFHVSYNVYCSKCIVVYRVCWCTLNEFRPGGGARCIQVRLWLLLHVSTTCNCTLTVLSQHAVAVAAERIFYWGFLKNFSFLKNFVKNFGYCWPNFRNF